MSPGCCVRPMARNSRNFWTSRSNADSGAAHRVFQQAPYAALFAFAFRRRVGAGKWLPGNRFAEKAAQQIPARLVFDIDFQDSISTGGEVGARGGVVRFIHCETARLVAGHGAAAINPLQHVAFSVAEVAD